GPGPARRPRTGSRAGRRRRRAAAQPPLRRALGPAPWEWGRGRRRHRPPRDQRPRAGVRRRDPGLLVAAVRLCDHRQADDLLRARPGSLRAGAARLPVRLHGVGARPHRAGRRRAAGPRARPVVGGGAGRGVPRVQRAVQPVPRRPGGRARRRRPPRVGRVRLFRKTADAPLLSVIVPVYNVQEYLAECLDSILHPPLPLEVVVVDDGSPDRSARIARKYARRDPRVTVVTRPNGGLSAARTTGIEHASAPYLTFVDSDDVVDPDGFWDAIHSLEDSGSDY